MATKNNTTKKDAPPPFDAIREWALAKNLTGPERISKQLNKLTEEVGELAAAINRQQLEETIDGIGDCVVVLTILAAQIGVNIETAIQAAYDTIKNRKGKTVNGIFIKDEEK